MDKTLMFLLFAIFTVTLIIGVFLYFKKNKSNNKSKNLKIKEIKEIKEKFTSEEKQLTKNPLYVSDNPKSPHFVPYTQPPGDKKAQKHAGSGQGTSGGFFPLQGNGAQLMMINSNEDNSTVSSNKSGKVGGYPNYTDEHFTSWSYGVNDFGSNGKISNSYLIDGANNRVTNNGQEGETSCDDFWPQAKKDKQGFCTTGNSSIAHCNGKNLLDCKEGIRYAEYKMKTQWEKVVDKIKRN
jgi:hypothetical protein